MTIEASFARPDTRRRPVSDARPLRPSLARRLELRAARRRRAESAKPIATIG